MTSLSAELLSRELEAWHTAIRTKLPEVAFCGCLRQAAGASSDVRSVATSIASRIRECVSAACWDGVQSGARYTRTWLGLFPRCASELAAARDACIFDALAHAL